jgi:hypothetical protein
VAIPKYWLGSLSERLLNEVIDRLIYLEREAARERRERESPAPPREPWQARRARYLEETGRSHEAQASPHA